MAKWIIFTPNQVSDEYHPRWLASLSVPLQPLKIYGIKENGFLCVLIHGSLGAAFQSLA